MSTREHDDEVFRLLETGSDPANIPRLKSELQNRLKKEGFARTLSQMIVRYVLECPDSPFHRARRYECICHVMTLWPKSGDIVVNVINDVLTDDDLLKTHARASNIYFFTVCCLECKAFKPEKLALNHKGPMSIGAEYRDRLKSYIQRAVREDWLEKLIRKLDNDAVSFSSSNPSDDNPPGDNPPTGNSPGGNPPTPPAP